MDIWTTFWMISTVADCAWDAITRHRLAITYFFVRPEICADISSLQLASVTYGGLVVGYTGPRHRDIVAAIQA